MHIYCKNCKKYTVTLILNNKIKGKSKWTICLTSRTFIDEMEEKYNLESELEVYVQFFVDWCYENEMETYSMKCRKDTENFGRKMFRTKNNRLILQLICYKCGIKKTRFIKQQETKGLLSNLGTKTPLSNIPFLNVLF